MDLSEAFSGSMATVGDNAAGVLYVMRCEPDPYTGERFNIGVFAVDKTGRRVSKVIDAAGRLECLYGEAASSVVWLAKAADEAARRGTASPSPQVLFDGPKAFYNESAEDAVARAFAELVTVALPQRQGTSPAPKVSDEDAQREVSDAVKSIMGLNFELLANTPQVLLETERGPWTVVIPLQPPQGVGTIRSADYAPATLKTHLMDSLLDLECAARYRHKRGLGLFLLRPHVRDSALQHAVDGVIDNVAHRAPANLHFEVAETAAALAQRIHTWGKGLAMPV